jgi:hypothetical protein
MSQTAIELLVDCTQLVLFVQMRSAPKVGIPVVFARSYGFVLVRVRVLGFRCWPWRAEPAVDVDSVYPPALGCLHWWWLGVFFLYLITSF